MKKLGKQESILDGSIYIRFKHESKLIYGGKSQNTDYSSEGWLKGQLRGRDPQKIFWKINTLPSENVLAFHLQLNINP